MLSSPFDKSLQIRPCLFRDRLAAPFAPAHAIDDGLQFIIERGGDLFWMVPPAEPLTVHSYTNECLGYRDKPWTTEDVCAVR